MNVIVKILLNGYNLFTITLKNNAGIGYLNPLNLRCHQNYMHLFFSDLKFLIKIA
jgi:hypothetical protein